MQVYSVEEVWRQLMCEGTATARCTIDSAVGVLRLAGRSRPGRQRVSVFIAARSRIVLLDVLPWATADLADLFRQRFNIGDHGCVSRVKSAKSEI